MKKMIVMMMLVLDVGGIASAGGQYPRTPVAPEIDAGSGMSALALLSGAVTLFRGRRKQ